MAKKRKAAAAENQETDIFAQLGWREPPAAADEPAEDSEDRLKTAEEKIAALSQQLDSATRANAALMSQAPVARVEPAAPVEPQVDMKGLPDPVTDPDGYHEQLTSRIVKAVEQSTQRRLETLQRASEERSAQAGRANALWEQFGETYPELAEHRDYVELAALKVTERAQQKGVDVQRYMGVGVDQFLADVAAETKKRFGKAISTESEADEAEETPKYTDPRQAMAEKMNGTGEPGEEPAGRTGGISGGVPTGAGGGAKPAGGSDFIADIHAMQRKLNLY